MAEVGAIQELPLHVEAKVKDEVRGWRIKAIVRS